MNANSDENIFLQLKKIVENSKKIVFLTGAGISKESGIPTFRDKDGLWKKYDPTLLASHTAFIENPNLVWDFFYSRQRLICQSDCNDAHKAIGMMEKIYKKDCWTITQNIDGLHQRAGSSNVVELHGNIFGVVCIHCGTRGEYHHSIFFKIFNEDKLPKCSICTKILKPNVVLFEEPLPQDNWNNAIELSSSCDVMIIVGTSLNVSPANTLPYYAINNNTILIEINPELTWMTSYMHYTLRGSASKILPKVLPASLNL